MADKYNRMFYNENVTGDPFIDPDAGKVSFDDDMEIDETKDEGLDPLIFCDECDEEDEGDSDD
ncbi:MAG TPA: hypothetical protein PKY19_07070 [Oscillospiraceae bacterium]|nr:hypothetical protein [Oscillospiraceae bacterium]